MTTRLSTLANGLRVATRAMTGVETVAVGLYAATGARFEGPQENGLAHLFEHMVFKGTDTRNARAIAEQIEDVGGSINAYTAREYTVFHARLLAGDLPLGVEMIADLLRRSRFDAEELEREKQVVLHELGEARDTPEDIVFDHLQEVAFPDQPLGRSILGDENSIGALGQADLRRWATEQYRPGSMVLAVAGKVDHDAFVALAEAWFGDLVDAPRPNAQPAVFGGGQRLDRRKFEQAHLALGYVGVPALDPAYFALRMFTDAVGGGMSSRLFQEVREEQGLAYSIDASLQAFDDAGLFTVYLATGRGESAQALGKVEEVLAAAARDLQPAEVERARAQVKAGLLMALEGCQGQADYLARQVALYGRLVDPAELIADIEAVTVDHARAAGAAMLATPRALAGVGATLIRAA